MALWFRSPVSIRRYAAGAYTGPDYAPGSTTTITILADIQPAPAADLIKQPEGQRQREQLAMFTSTAMITGDEQGLQKADVVLYNGKEYEVVAVARHTRLLPHLKCTLLSVPATDG